MWYELATRALRDAPFLDVGHTAFEISPVIYNTIVVKYNYQVCKSSYRLPFTCSKRPDALQRRFQPVTTSTAALE